LFEARYALIFDFFEPMHVHDNLQSLLCFFNILLFGAVLARHQLMVIFKNIKGRVT